MSVPAPCPKEQTISALLAGSLSGAQREALTTHLQACPACRKVLDRLAGLDDSLPAVTKCLESGLTPTSPALRQAMAELRRADSRSAETLAPDPAHAAASRAPLQLGQYQIQGLLGQGGMGKVYRAFDPNLHRVVAIKVMSDALAVSGPARQRFMREARSAAVVTHENVVVIHEVNGAGEVPYLVMQFVAGQSLEARIEKEGALPLADVVRIGMQTAAGLAAAHKQGLVHRDVKPANILLENGVDRVKLTDFGLARAVDDASLTQSGVIAGTPAFMSPEQASGEHVDHRSDLFSLGGVIYTMATGHPPFRASNTMAVLMKVTQEAPRPIREVNPDMPDWLEKVVAKLLAKDVKKRFQSADEVAELLGKALAKLQTADKPATPRKRLQIAEAEEVDVHGATVLARPKQRSALPLLLGGAAAVVLLIAAGLGAAWGLGLLAGGKKPDDKPVDNPVEAEWVQLFNRNDLTGWKREKDGDGNWKVAGGILSCSGEEDYLYSEHEYDDFHLRAEVRLEAKGNSGIYFRVGKPLQPHGDYEAQITNDPGQVFKTGSLQRLVRETRLLVPDDKWFTYEIIAQGNRILLLVNGEVTAEYVDRREGRRSKGHLALQHWNKQTKVEFRKIEIKKPPNPMPPVSWVQLFNGKDTTGWTREGKGPDNWKVSGGVLSCSGGRDHLYTAGGDYDDFHLRADVRLNAEGNSGIYFRAGKPLKLVGDYEAQISNLPNQVKTGSLYGLVKEERLLVKDDTWFTYEIIAQGDRIRLLVNGEVTADYVEREGRRTTGHIALQHHDSATKAEFSRVEIKKLAPSDGWVPLFNGKDLSGWKKPDAAVWGVEQGNLIGRSSRVDHLFSERDDYENFILRVEAKVNKHGNSGVYFRCSGDDKPAGYEAQILHSYPRQNVPLTGSLYKFHNVTESRFETEDWFTMTVIAVGNQLTIKVNGVQTVGFTDEANTYRKGHLALQAMSDQVVGKPTIVQFRKIEIMELPPSK